LTVSLPCDRAENTRAKRWDCFLPTWNGRSPQNEAAGNAEQSSKLAGSGRMQYWPRPNKEEHLLAIFGDSSLRSFFIIIDFFNYVFLFILFLKYLFKYVKL
jgi:hypothetical protein